MKRLLLICVLAISLIGLTGCPSRTVDLKYYDVSPKYVGATAFSEATDPVGVNLKTQDRYLIDKDGNVQPVKTDSASGVGPVGSIVQSAETSGATTAIAGPIMGVLIPGSNKSTTNVTVGK